jgi:histidyl-tRNA synthetase
VAQRQGRLVLPLRWFSYGPFWRYERPQRGRTREFFQWNIDLIGCDAPSADGELVSIGALFLQQVGLPPDEVGVFVNSRRLLDDKLADIGIAPDRRRDVLQLIDRRAKMAPASWEARALEIGLAAPQLDALKAVLADAELWRESEALCQVFATAQALGVADYVTYDAGVVRGLDYYTGVVFEAFDRPRELRSIFGGGRYDNLVADVGGEPISAVGMAMGDAVIEVLLGRAGRRPKLPPTPGRVLVTLFSAELYGPALALATRVREAGINAEQVLVPDRLGRQLRMADRKGIPYALILGPDELAAGQVILKELSTGEQLVCSPEEAIARLAPG